jgi:hypothetical protein
MRPTSLAAAVLCLTAAFGPAAPPAGADWLVTREGGRVETRGAWEVKGRLVVFRAADGNLSSLRLADVNLDASRKATAEAGQARAGEAPPRPPARRPVVLSITDKDVRQAAPAAKPPGGDPKSPETPADPPASAPSGLGVATWQRSLDGTGGSVVVTGTVRNGSPGTAGDIKLTVILYDEAGAPLRAVPAALTATALPPGEQAEFRAEFPDVFGFASIRFDLKSPSFATAAASNGGG